MPKTTFSVRILQVILLAIGVAAILVAVLADRIGLGTPGSGLGGHEIVMLAAGSLVVGLLEKKVRWMRLSFEWFLRRKILVFFVYNCLVVLIGLAIAEHLIRRLRPETRWLHLARGRHIENVIVNLQPDTEFHHFRSKNRPLEFPVPDVAAGARVMVVGDSFVYGYGDDVGVRNRFGTLLDEHLGDAIKVDVLAVPSYATTIYRNIIERALSITRYDAVVVCIDQTDPIDNKIYAEDLISDGTSHRFDVVKMYDRLQAVRAWRAHLRELLHGWRGIPRRLALVNALFDIQFHSTFPKNSPHYNYVQYSYGRSELIRKFSDAPALPSVKEMERMLFEDMDYIVNLCREREAMLFLVANPWEYQVYSEPWMPTEFKGPFPRNNRLEELLSDRYGSTNGVHVIAMTREFRERINVGNLFQVNDFHWSRLGHALVESSLRECLLTHVSMFQDDTGAMRSQKQTTD